MTHCPLCAGRGEIMVKTNVDGGLAETMRPCPFHCQKPVGGVAGSMPLAGNETTPEALAEQLGMKPRKPYSEKGETVNWRKHYLGE